MEISTFRPFIAEQPKPPLGLSQDLEGSASLARHRTAILLSEGSSLGDTGKEGLLFFPPTSGALELFSVAKE